VSLNRDEYIEELEEEHKKLSNEQIERHLDRMNDLKVRMGREIEEYRDKYREKLDENLGLTKALSESNGFRETDVLMIVLGFMVGFIIAVVISDHAI
jgi:hypothetical protein